ncbi:MAG: putative hydrolase YxeP [Alphaproteobacteria bacterium MarineAlpha5_Bin9]|nr:MAG: putative hydrolase YxeP [Alphaproteobacteria bacterium MarineAlpha5_Bin9]|tara:strand:+ start:5075 stop:6247 length:1173 start_codon:yes stop_codon:yes gene_type:complete
MAILNSINQMLNEMTKWRKDLHKNPEIGLKEKETSQYIQTKLKTWQIEYKSGYANTGLVAWIKGNKGNSKKSIGLRADMDALPMPEHNNFEHKSSNEGMMHACGHDGHTTMLLGAAKYLKENPNFDGTVFFIFQPGEEGWGGGKMMMDDGLFKDFEIDEVYALHNWPELPLGEFGVTDGPMMAAVDEFDIIVEGKGGHAALPNLAVDPIVIASQIVLSMQTIVSRFIDPVDKALVSITKIHGGTAYNVIDDKVSLNGTVRTFKNETRVDIEKKIKEIASGIALANNAKAHIQYYNKYPPTINHKEKSIFASDVAKDLVGKDKVFTNINPSMGGEDFSYMLNEKPGSYLYIGQKDENHYAGLHTSKYDFNDNLLPIGVNFWVELVNKYFSK